MQMSQVQILSGTYHDKPVSGVFNVVKDYQVGARGGFITVENNGHPSMTYGGSKVRVRISNEGDFNYLGNRPQSSARPSNVSAFIPQSAEPAVVAPVETDEEAMDRIKIRFEILDEMAKACITSDIRALIVSGPPGVGKSFGVQAQLEMYSTFDRLANKKVRYEIVKGAMSALGLYSTLYKFSDPKNVLVFDDCDIFHDEDALNILKAALDSGKRRKIFWNTDSRKLRDEGIPSSFDFKGSVIFITNLQLANSRGKIAAHIDALQSRAHYLDLTINTERDRMLRIKQVHRDADGGLFKDYDFTGTEDQQILDFMWDNRDRMREVSMRMALKIADLVKISPTNWRMLTENTCMRNVK
jgi:hypothetical protein